MTTTPVRPPRVESAPTIVARRPWLALAAVLAGSFLHIFDLMVITVAVPSIRDDLHASAAAAQWMLAGYTLPFALLLITSGRLGDAIGRRWMVLAGSFGFTVASVLCAVASDPSVLITGRILQGASAAAMSPQVLPVIMLLFPAARRIAALGAQAGVIAVATVSGPVIGGLLVQADIAGLGWRSIFLLNVPVGLFTVLAGVRWLPRNDTVLGRVRLDLGSVALASLGLLMLIFPLVQGRDLGWPLWTFGLLAGSVPVLILTMRRQRSGDFPLIAVSLFRVRAFVAGSAANFLVMGAVAAFFLVFVMYMQSGLGYGPAEIGITMASFALAAGAASGASVPLARKVGRPMLVTGALLMALGMALLLAVLLVQGSTLAASAVAACLALVGIGMGLLSPPLYNLTLTDVPAEDVGSASGVFGTLAQVGSALGVATIGALFFGLLTTLASPARLGPCLATTPLTEGTQAVLDHCAPNPTAATMLADHAHAAFTSATAVTVAVQILCYLVVAALLTRFLPKHPTPRP
ncbi:MAG TPA: MFS transporter [Actinophytocola sp.]|uniref:MFS transporter n=1 Tax=Actinophytocola sp. TaxID=1872138 RepID=UPI002DF916DE|nr:MFS transporter [Actinophytocola sp.]